MVFCGFPFDLGKFDLGIPHIPDIPDIPDIPEIFDLGISSQTGFFLGGVFSTTWARTPIPYTTRDQRNWIFFQGELMFIGFLLERVKDRLATDK